MNDIVLLVVALVALCLVVASFLLVMTLNVKEFHAMRRARTGRKNGNETGDAATQEPPEEDGTP